jgi:hypothetical protein
MSLLAAGELPPLPRGATPDDDESLDDPPLPKFYEPDLEERPSGPESKPGEKVSASLSTPENDLMKGQQFRGEAAALARTAVLEPSEVLGKASDRRPHAQRADSGKKTKRKAQRNARRRNRQ